MAVERTPPKQGDTSLILDLDDVYVNKRVVNCASLGERAEREVELVVDTGKPGFLLLDGKHGDASRCGMSLFISSISTRSLYGASASASGTFMWAGVRPPRD